MVSYVAGWEKQKIGKGKKKKKKKDGRQAWAKGQGEIFFLNYYLSLVTFHF